jgi:GAF domain-containing protein
MFRPGGRHLTGEVPVLGAELADAATEDDALARVVGQAVPELADLCAVHLFDDDGAARCAATAAVDGVDRRLIGRLTARLRPTADWESLGRTMPLPSVVFVPLALDGRTNGVMTAATVRPERRLGPGDLDALRRLGYQAALVLENLRLSATLEQVRNAIRSAEHDIRNPLAVIALHAELSQLRAAALGSPEAVHLDEAMKRILTAVATARHLVAHLGSHSRLDCERPS